jgi:hypothetical protein
MTDTNQDNPGESREVLELKKIEAFGGVVKAFLESDVGRHLVRRAELERQAALDEMADGDVTNINRMRELQMVVRRADSIQQWLADAIMDAHAAADTLNFMETE